MPHNETQTQLQNNENSIYHLSEITHPQTSNPISPTKQTQRRNPPEAEHGHRRLPVRPLRRLHARAERAGHSHRPVAHSAGRRAGRHLPVGRPVRRGGHLEPQLNQPGEQTWEIAIQQKKSITNYITNYF